MYIKKQIFSKKKTIKAEDIFKNVSLVFEPSWHLTILNT